MRITIDLDNPDNLKIQMCYYNLWCITKINPLIRLSASGKGVHLKVHGVLEGEVVVNDIRRMLGDDSVRIKFDEERIAKPKQVLWTVKNSNKAGVWTDDIDLVLSNISKRRLIKYENRKSIS